jgi:hypothetical protein
MLRLLTGLRSLVRLAAVLYCTSAAAQFDGVPASPALSTSITSPLAAVKIRLGPPVIPFGPTLNADTPPNFICPVPGSAPCYVFSSNQAPQETSATSPTTGYSAADGSTTSTGVTPATTGYGVTVSGVTTQYIGHNFNTVPTGTASFTSKWSQPVPDNSVGALAPGVSTDQCGAWPTSSYKVGSLWYLFVHNEGPCDYVDPLGNGQIGYTNESSSLWQSSTAAPGTWTAVTGAGSPGTIISSTAPLVPGWLTGFGDATIIPGNDGYMYAYGTFYCQYSICDYQNSVARAPLTNLAPGNWRFLYGGCWCAPALNNPWDNVAHLPQADLIPFVGSSVTTMPQTPFKVLAVDGKNHAYWRNHPGAGSNIGGIALSISLDYRTFYTFPTPLVNYDFQNFVGRPSADDLYIYATLRDDVTGGSVLSSTHFALWAVYVPPNNSLNSRYYEQWPATMTLMTIAQQRQGIPQMGVTLETWTNSSTGNTYSGRLRSTTVNPYPGISADGATETGWAPSTSLGYLMTNCPGSTANVQDCDANGRAVASRIEECWLASGDDYGLKVDTGGTGGSCPSGWVHVRTVGWVYKSPQSFGTKPVYECFNSGGGYHFASNDSTCGGQTQQGLLGYAMTN